MCGLFRGTRITNRHLLRPAFLTLEDRRLLSAFNVTSTADDGSSGTLRWAVAQADAATSSSTIELELGTSPATITLAQGQLELSNIAYPTTIYDGLGQGPVTISGNNASEVFQIDPGVTVGLTGLTITGGSTNGYGGGLSNSGTVNLSDCTISGNSAFIGGGLYNAATGTANLTDCTISGNTGVGSGGGVFNLGTASLTACTISGNSTPGSTSGTKGAAPFYMTRTGDGQGGGIRNDGTANLTECTISGNMTGGGMWDYGTATLLACTIYGNNAGFYDYEHPYASNPGTATLTDTIVAGNGYLNLNDDGPWFQAGTLTTTYDMLGLADSLGPTDVYVALDALLGPLGNYGGPTETVPVLPGCPAIGAGTPLAGITTDQRGEPYASTPDIGAYQEQGFNITVVADSTPQSAATGSTFAIPLAVTVTANDPVNPVAGGQVTFTAPSTYPIYTVPSATFYPNYRGTSVANGDSPALVSRPMATWAPYTVTATASGSSRKHSTSI